MIVDNIIFAIFIFLGVSAFVIARDCLHCKKWYCIKVDSVVIKTYKTHHILGNGMVAKFRYIYDGKEYESMSEDEYEGDFIKKYPVEAGYDTSVFVNPENPKKIRISNKNETFNGVILLVVGILLLCAAAYGIGHEILAVL